MLFYIMHLFQVTEQYQLWADETSKLFGGLDICTVDAIHDATTSTEQIMEVRVGQGGAREPRCSRTLFRLCGASEPTFVHVECMCVVYTNVVHDASQPCI